MSKSAGQPQEYDDAVIGGGLAGIYAALLLARQGRHVVLVEKSPTIGGLLRSIRYEEGYSFDYGTHVPSETGVPGIDSLLFEPLKTRAWHQFPYNKAGNFSLGKLNPHSPFIDIRNLGSTAFDAAADELLERSTLPNGQANQTLELEATFGPTLCKGVFSPALEKFFGRPPSELAPDARRLFGLTRVMGLPKEQTAELKRDLVFDSKIAFHSYKEGDRKISSFYPKSGGVGQWIDFLTEQLRFHGVDIQTGAHVQSIHKKDHLISGLSLNDGSSLRCTQVIWTLPASLLLNLLTENPRPASPPEHARIDLHHLVVNTPPSTDLQYMTCYDPSFRTFRVTLYSNLQDSTATGEPCRATVEVLYPGPLLNVPPMTTETVLNELVGMGLFSRETRVNWSGHQTIPMGFPIITTGFLQQCREQAARTEEAAGNIIFLGRAGGGAFFVNDVLRQAYGRLATSLLKPFPR